MVENFTNDLITMKKSENISNKFVVMLKTKAMKQSQIHVWGCS